MKEGTKLTITDVICGVAFALSTGFARGLCNINNKKASCFFDICTFLKYLEKLYSKDDILKALSYFTTKYSKETGANLRISPEPFSIKNVTLIHDNDKGLN